VQNIDHGVLPFGLVEDGDLRRPAR